MKFNKKGQFRAIKINVVGKGVFGENCFGFLFYFARNSWEKQLILIASMEFSAIEGDFSVFLHKIETYRNKQFFSLKPF